MLTDIWIAYEETERAQYALRLASQLARASSARLTVAHVAAPVDEALDDQETLGLELLGLDEHRERLRHLRAVAAAAAPQTNTEVRLAYGPPLQQLLDWLDHERPDLVVAGMRDRQSALASALMPGIGRALLRRAGCPVLVVRATPSDRVEQLILACDGPGLATPRAHRTVQRLASGPAWRIVPVQAPRGRRDRPRVEAIVAAYRRHRPALAVVARQRAPTLRAAIGLSSAEAVVEALPCPVLVVPPGG